MIYRKLYPFQNVVATGMATVSLSNLLGWTINRVILQLGGGALTKAMLTGLRMKANTKTIFDDTGARTDDRMEYRGIAANAAFLTLDFSEIRSKTVQGQLLGAIDTTAGIETLNIEADIAGATTPTLAGYAELSEPQTGLATRGLIAKVLNVTQGFAAAGTFPFQLDFGKEVPTTVKRVHFFGSTVTAVEVKKRGISIFEALPDAVNDFIQTEYQRTPQANVYHVDFIVDGNQSNALPLMKESPTEFLVTVSGAGNVTAVVELLDPLGNN
jgi:hypothetical protein